MKRIETLSEISDEAHSLGVALFNGVHKVKDYLENPNAARQIALKEWAEASQTVLDRRKPR